MLPLNLDENSYRNKVGWTWLIVRNQIFCSKCLHLPFISFSNLNSEPATSNFFCLIVRLSVRVKWWNFSKIHSPHEIISTAGKTGHNSWWKRNQSWNVFIHISNKSASVKTRCTNRIFKTSLFQFNFVLSKILLIKNIPSCHFESVHLRHQWA